MSDRFSSFALPLCLHGAVMALSLGSVALHCEETLFLPKTAGPLGQVLQFISFRFPVQPDLCCAVEDSTPRAGYWTQTNLLA